MSFFKSLMSGTGNTPKAGEEAAAAAEEEPVKVGDGVDASEASDKATSSDNPAGEDADPATAAAAADNSNSNEPMEDPEREKLEDQVSDRDASLSALEKARKEKQQELAALEKELEDERLNQMKEALIHKIESERLKRQTQHAEERLKALEHDMQDKAAIHEYANLIKSVAPQTGADS